MHKTRLTVKWETSDYMPMMGAVAYDFPDDREAVILTPSRQSKPTTKCFLLFNHKGQPDHEMELLFHARTGELVKPAIVANNEVLLEFPLSRKVEVIVALEKWAFGDVD